MVLSASLSLMNNLNFSALFGEISILRKHTLHACLKLSEDFCSCMVYRVIGCKKNAFQRERHKTSRPLEGCSLF